VLHYSSNSGMLAPFTSGVVNTDSTDSGEITFNGANATGATGNTNVLTVTFDVVGFGTSALDLAYSDMAAATTIADLLPTLTIHDGQVVVSHTVLGDANGNGTVTAADALLALTADAQLSIPSQYCPMTCGDANKDGKVTSTDALIILTYDAGLPTGNFPVGTGSCPTTVTKPTGCP
jgi:hypothetical protein